MQRYGKRAGISTDVFSEAGDFTYDADGTLWIRSGASGAAGEQPPSVKSLVGMLDEVKALCKDRFGRTAVEEVQSSWSDEDGTPWVQVGAASSERPTDEANCFKGTCSLQ